MAGREWSADVERLLVSCRLQMIFSIPQDIAENVVVKIADEVEVDVSRQAWQVRYADAIATAETITIEGVRVPFLSLEMLIKSKTTYREQDRADLVRLRDLLELKRIIFSCSPVLTPTRSSGAPSPPRARHPPLSSRLQTPPAYRGH